MTASDKKKTGVLVVLLLVAGVTWGWMYRSGITPSTPGPAEKAEKGAKAPKALQDAQIRFDLLKTEPAEGVGRKNLFQYRQAPLPARAAEPVRSYAPPPITSTPINQATTTPVTPQSKSFRYEGFSASKTAGILATISEGGNTYSVRQGDCVMGQYCVRRLTERDLEIEDLQLKSSRTFTRVQ